MRSVLFHVLVSENWVVMAHSLHAFRTNRVVIIFPIEAQVKGARKKSAF